MAAQALSDVVTVLIPYLPDGVSQGQQLLKQLASIGFTAVFAPVATVVILGAMRMVMGDLRAHEEDEAMGLDLSQHSETAYGLGEGQ